MDIKNLLLSFIAVTGFFGICATPSAKAESSADNFSFTVSPEDGTEMDKLAKVVIAAAEQSDEYYFTQTDFIEADDFPYADAGAYFICGETRVDASCNAMWSQDVTIVPNKPITAKGEWTLVIEPGALQWGYDDDDYVWHCVWTNHEALTYTYSITGNADEQPEEAKLPFTTDPESGATLQSLETVTLNFIPALDEYANNSVNPFLIYFAKDGEKLENISVKVSEKYSENKIVLTASEPITENGSYQLVIEPRALDINYDEAFDGSYYFINKEKLTFDYTVENDFSSIQPVITTPNTIGVYNLMGVKIADSLDSVAPGCYIVNGKKILITK